MSAIAVLGGAGFLGSHVADALSDAGHSVKVIDRIRSKWLRSDQVMIEADIADENELAHAFTDCDVVYNFAGVADIAEANEDPVRSARVNILGNLNAIEACLAEGVRRYVFASTMYVYSRAGGAYRCSKQACESYIHHYHQTKGLEYTVLRYGSLYGPRSDLRNGIHRFIYEAIKRSKIEYHGSPDALREHIHVFDAARSSVDILHKDFANKHVLITGLQTIRMSDLFRMISEVLNKEIGLDFLNDGVSGHYETTPYSFTPQIGIKYLADRHVDLGQGLLLKIDEIFNAVDEKAEIEVKGSRRP